MEGNVWMKFLGWLLRYGREAMQAEDFFAGRFFRETSSAGVVYAEHIIVKPLSAICGVYEVKHIFQEKRGDCNNRSVTQSTQEWLACFSSSRRQLLELDGGRVLSAIPEKKEVIYLKQSFKKSMLECVKG